MYKRKDFGDVDFLVKGYLNKYDIKIVIDDGFSKRFINNIKQEYINGERCIILQPESIGGYQNK